MATAFSDDGSKTIQRSIDVLEKTNRTSFREIDVVYEIEKTCSFITDRGFKKVALQFPDELLTDAPAIVSKLEKNTTAKLFILGDTSYGSCCVDEVAAEHLEADSIVHYGRACLSPSRRLPVMYVFGQKPVDVHQCAASFRVLYPDKYTHVIILCDVIYSYVVEELQQLLHSEYENLVVSMIYSGQNEATDPCGTDGFHSGGACCHVEFPDEAFNGEETDVSLVTGALRATHLLKSEWQNKASSTSLIHRNDTLAITQSHSAASFLATRSWQGLEQKLGETSVSKAVEGRKGIAIAYEGEDTS
ncbi:2-(3-amino-3-carboxypropyl)histidine synthase subunit 2 isoform X2 [Carcharodon carcharias]|uniref:2-(3-amino-3-carboxypropyl)histidine synthase subunit 2 isoform X2 n=1 Tax=Carcharodon carcharias TaxID=13397 RepID=UPI001B7F2EC7|nr:2-(3-amino-3-carboxypropyl)histidine synthase subunit 2 isoform X2 [Carcharodon carcharias]